MFVVTLVITTESIIVQNVSVNSKSDRRPPGDPQGFTRFHCPGIRFLPNIFCPGGRGFGSEILSYSVERKMQELLDLFQRKPEAA